MKTMLAAMASVAIGCGETNPRPPEAPLVVSPATLVRLYRDTPRLAHDSYTGRRIHCVLEPGSFVVRSDCVGWAGAVPEAEPSVLFAGAVPAGLVREDRVEAVGVCLGVVNGSGCVTVFAESLTRFPTRP